MPLIEKVETLLPTPAEGEEAPQESVTDLLTVALHADQGTVPTWSRPGRFLVWFGPIPVLCTWRGMVSTDCYLEPADPRALWIDEDVTIEKSGHVQATDASVDAVFRRWLEAMANSVTPRSRNNKPEHTMKLRHLDRIHEQAVRDHLGRSRWLQEALRRGPVNPVPMPQHLLFAQPALIG